MKAADNFSRVAVHLCKLELERLHLEKKVMVPVKKVNLSKVQSEKVNRFHMILTKCPR